VRGKAGLAVEDIVIPCEQDHPSVVTQTPNRTNLVLLGVNYAHFEVHKNPALQYILGYQTS
jgi:hypothetical protein